MREEKMYYYMDIQLQIKVKTVDSTRFLSVVWWYLMDNYHTDVHPISNFLIWHMDYVFEKLYVTYKQRGKSETTSASTFFLSTREYEGSMTEVGTPEVSLPLPMHMNYQSIFQSETVGCRFLFITYTRLVFFNIISSSLLVSSILIVLFSSLTCSGGFKNAYEIQMQNELTL